MSFSGASDDFPCEFYNCVRALADNQLLVVAPSPIVQVNRAVAVAEVEGPDAALTLLDGLDLEDYYLFHAVRADMLRRLGRDEEAATAYEAVTRRPVISAGFPCEGRLR